MGFLISRRGAPRSCSHGRAPRPSAGAQGNPPARAEQSALATPEGCRKLVRASKDRRALGKLPHRSSPSLVGWENPPPIPVRRVNAFPKDRFSLRSPTAWHNVLGRCWVWSGCLVLRCYAQGSREPAGTRGEGSRIQATEAAAGVHAGAPAGWSGAAPSSGC